MTAFLIVVSLAALVGAWVTRRPVLEAVMLAAAPVAALAVDATDPHPAVVAATCIAAVLWAWRVTGWADRLAETAP